VDRELSEQAQRLAQKGAGLAGDAGFEAEGLAIAEDADVPVHETIVGKAKELDAAAIVVGAHGHGRLGEVLLGSTSREVIRHAHCPVLVARRPEQ
jgi:nucleotide-binding universal stress UspA family protein